MKIKFKYFIYLINNSNTIDYEEFLKKLIGEMNKKRK